MASPSRSGSVAIRTRSAVLDFFLRSVMNFLIWENSEFYFKIVIDVNSQFIGWKVLHMPYAGNNIILRSQVLLDRFNLGG